MTPTNLFIFKGGTGLTTDAWLAAAQAMTRRLADNQVIEAEEFTAYTAQLRRMAEFIRKQEGDARGWIKDPVRLQVTLQALQERKATTEKLVDVLVELEGARP